MDRDVDLAYLEFCQKFYGLILRKTEQYGDKKTIILNRLKKVQLYTKSIKILPWEYRAVGKMSQAGFSLSVSRIRKSNLQ